MIKVSPTALLRRGHAVFEPIPRIDVRIRETQRAMNVRAKRYAFADSHAEGAIEWLGIAVGGRVAALTATGMIRLESDKIPLRMSFLGIKW